MNPKQLKRVAIALVVVLVLWGAAEIIGGGRDDSERVSVLPSLQSTDVDTIMILSQSDTVVLASSAGEWTVNGLEAAPTEVESFFAALADSGEAELISTGESVHARMEVDEAYGKHMRFVKGSSVVADLVFGKSGRRYNSRYVRSAGDNAVYLYVGDVSRFVNRVVDDWRNKRILDLQPDSIQLVAVQRASERYTLLREAADWRFSTGVGADSAAVARLLDQYSALDASGFANEAQADSADFTDPDRAVTIVGQPGDTLAALVFDSTASAFWVRHPSGGTIYRILQWKANQMVPAESTLVAKEEDQG
jgi:hypothetical protein